MPASSKEAQAARERHRFIAGKGYLRMAPLRMPTKPQGAAPACEPPLGTPGGTQHRLKAPNGAIQAFTWHADVREWAPPLGQGRRVGFSSAYLAGHGWIYEGPEA